MKRAAAVVQIVIILLIVGYGTYNLFLGNFEQSMATLPLLMIYYVFVVVRHKRTQSKTEKHIERADKRHNPPVSE
jgi:integral membrane sensor domain MASE1